ncbi:MAG: hypothetical protein RIS70_2878 [Planctomycetota bacterium]|jgi:hypothetical protein
MIKRWWMKVARGLALATTCSTGAWAFVDHAAAQEDKPPKVEQKELRLELTINPDGEVGNAVISSEDGPAEYWIGVTLDPATNDALKAHLGFSDGLLITSVFPDSPAAKAGLKIHDIVLKAGDAVVKEPADLVAAVAKSQGKELQITLIRAAKEMNVSVAPVKRPKLEAGPNFRIEGGAPLGIELDGIPFGNDPARIGAEQQRQLEKALEALRKSGDPRQGMSMFFLRPGIVGNGDPTKSPPPVALPKNVTVQVTKEGDQPAKIVVKRDDQTWETSEGNLNQLPEEIRLFVQQAMQAGQGGMAWRMLAPVPGSAPGAYLPPGGEGGPRLYREPRTMPPVEGMPFFRPERIDGELQKKLSDLFDEVKQLRKEVNDLRTGQGNK